MKNTVLKNGERVLIPTLWIANDFFSRFLGLMGRKTIGADEALYFPRCNSIHTFFMRFPIDVVFLDGENTVVEVIENLPAWRMLLPRKAKHIIELAPRRASELGIVKGQRLEI